MKRRLTGLLLPVFGGLLIAMAFPDAGMWGLAWIGLVPLLVTIHSDTGWRTVFFRSWLLSVTAFLVDLSWVRISMQEYGGVPAWMSLFFLFLLAAYCALFQAAAVMAAVSIARRLAWPLIAVLPAMWVAFEYFREKLISGFPWNSLGQSQFAVLPILQNADWGSFYGISFLIVLVNTAIAAAILRAGFWKRQAVIACVLVAAATGYGFVRLSTPESDRTFTAGIVQGNIDQHMKWAEDGRRITLDRHIGLTEPLLEKSPDLLVWPESALAFYYRFAARYAPYGDDNPGRRIRSLVKRAGVPLIAGTLDRIGDAIYNSAVMIRPDGLESYYYKEHLVPFGEYVPGGKLLFFVNRLVDNAIGEFSTGTFTGPFVYDKGAVGMTVCYEQIFPELVRQRVRKGADVICNITNDSWFGRSSAALQHFSASCFRAVENRRPVIRAANTGISGAVDTRGRILTATPLFVPEARVVTVHLSREMTFYQRFGDVFCMICVLLSAVLCIIACLVGNSQDTNRRKNR